ncbi:hypothetical protein [Acinetobacter sp. ANC 3791]|uniref:hypothetical protein n=1 Tax=Acinetobacter sp. ANC 3791 TaxID=2529836 RepID=UPI00103B8509|nr:hypothetical protein [Acinetobacter sp. ANC 3791]TCB83335.1 hypothetical protein E0H90_11440 [Acinetobacter sp. ANC 3791]
MTCTSCSCNDLVLELLQTLKAQIQNQAQQNNLLAQIVEQNNELIAPLYDEEEKQQSRSLDDD